MIENQKNADPRDLKIATIADALFSKGPADVLDHATTEMAIGTKLGLDAEQLVVLGQALRAAGGTRLDLREP